VTHTIDLTDRRALTGQPIVGLLADRWSPRSFDPDAALTDAQVTSLLEAARWAPSASNKQPRRFVVGRRGTPEFDALFAALTPGNQPWAHRAAALIGAIAITESPEGEPYRWSEYDTGQAVAHLTVQAHAEGLHVHQIGGFLPDQVRESFGLDERHVPVVIAAVGVAGHASLLEEPYLTREQAPRQRLSLDELVITAR
jgi:nitroreductase